MKELEITVKTLYGFEKILQDELAELGYKKTTPLNRAVQLNGGWEDVYRLNYRCRLAISVLVKIKSFSLHKEDDLYKEAKKIDWPNYFDVEKTFAVKGAIFSTLFSHTQYPMLVVKDAIADVFRDEKGKRPNVNIKAPQVLIDLYVKDKTATLSINTSGKPLFQRGYRQETGDAPMNEVLASGIIRLSGWDRKSTFINPMCGSGTLAIEAALWAADIPAMIERHHYAFKNFSSYDESIWERVQAEGNHRPIPLDFEILASDIDGQMVNMAKRNSRMAPIGNMIKFERQDMLTLEAPNEKGILICNPPYGERMGDDSEELELLYQNMGDAFKTNFTGYSCWVISSNIDVLKHLGLRPDKKIKLYNGKLECSFRQFKVFEGTRIEKIKEIKGDDFIEEPVKEKPVKVKHVKETPIKEKPKSASKYDSKTGEEANKVEKKPRFEKKETPKDEIIEKPKSTSSKYGNKPERRQEEGEKKTIPEKQEISSSKYGIKTDNQQKEVEEKQRYTKNSESQAEKIEKPKEKARTRNEDVEEQKETAPSPQKKSNTEQENVSSKYGRVNAFEKPLKSIEKKSDVPSTDSPITNSPSTKEEKGSGESLKEKIERMKKKRD